MAKTYLVTCGTSCYSNYCKKKLDGCGFMKLNELSKNLGTPKKELQEDMLRTVTQCDAPDEISAEINTLLTIGLESCDNIVLFHGHTDISILSAKAIEGILLSKSLCGGPELVEIKQLATAKKDLIKGLGEMANKLVAKHDEYIAMSDEVVFVVTGGFKAMTAVASVVAMLKGCQTMYLFEHSEVPGNIGVLPLALNENMIPSNIRALLAHQESFEHRELRSHDLSDEQIAKWFIKDKDTSLYTASPIASLLSEDGPQLPSCTTNVPVKVAEAKRNHNYIKWGNISEPEQIPDSASRKLLSSLSRALAGYAKCIYLGEFDHRGEQYGICYRHRKNQTVKLSVTMPGQSVFLTVHPERSIKELDDLCQALFRK